MATKPCKECGAVKPLDGFPRHKEMADGHLNRCKVCQTAYLKAYGEKNKAHLQEAAKNRYEANKDEIVKRVREHWHKNADAINARRRARYANDQEHREKVLERCRISNAKTRPARRKKRRKNDPAYLYLERYRRRMWHALKGRGAKSASTLELIGCSGEELERYLETTKVPGKDYTICHVDHIIPCSAFKMAIPEHQRVCFHWSNLQLLPGRENMSKNDKIPDWAQDILDCGGTILDAGDLQREIIQDARIIL